MVNNPKRLLPANCLYAAYAGKHPADTLEVCIFSFGFASLLSFALLSISTSVRSLRSLATPNGDAQSRLPQPKASDPFPTISTRLQILSLSGRTEIRSFAKLELTKHNVVRLGGEFASNQRLSGLARERSERTQCQT
ncbi:MAG: hypothetical protein COB24_09820 [Hyphomicrobiales bacterium]|nr:MAG: hypothetical protein COB24_09820 [Hyphomicrobiales bacterium]